MDESPKQMIAEQYERAEKITLDTVMAEFQKQQKCKS